MENANAIQVNIDRKINYVKENSNLLQLIEKFKESNPELYATKEILLLITFLTGSLFLLVQLIFIFNILSIMI